MHIFIKALSSSLGYNNYSFEIWHGCPPPFTLYFKRISVQPSALAVSVSLLITIPPEEQNFQKFKENEITLVNSIL